jgi:acetolactate synthase-1/2/3 large subunit
MTKLSDAVFQIVAEYTSHVFTLPGGFSMHLNDSLNHSALTSVYCLHEAGAGFAATGYAKYNGGLGVVLVTSGPGCTNVLTAVASAYQDSVPLLILSGEAKLENIEKRQKYQLRQGGAQDVEIMRIARSITKYVEYISTPADIHFVRLCILEAMKPRCGPVWLAIPLDMQAVEV